MVVPRLGSVRNQFLDSGVRDVTEGAFMSDAQPGSTSSMQSGSTSSTPHHRTGSGTTWKALTGLLALACVVLVFLLLRPAEEAEAEGGPTATADSSATLACEVLRETAPFPDDELDSDEASVDRVRLSVAAALGMLAEEQDTTLATLAQHLREPSRTFAATFSMDSPEFHDALDLATSACADRFPSDQ